MIVVDIPPSDSDGFKAFWRTVPGKLVANAHHESAHAVAGILAGREVERVKLAAPEEGERGYTIADEPGAAMAPAIQYSVLLFLAGRGAEHKVSHGAVDMELGLNFPA